MAWRSGIWNALPDADGDYDRKYNGDDYSDPLGYIIGNGIVTNTKVGSSNTEDIGTALQVINPVVTGATYGVTIKSGWGWINGKWFCNPTDDNTSIINIAAPTQGNKRYDRLVVRRDNRVADGRLFYPVLIKGEQVASGTPAKPNIVRNDQFYDLCIAEILINRGDTITVSIRDTRSDAQLCGLCNGYFGDSFNNYVNTLTNVFNKELGVLQDRADDWVDNNSLTKTVVYRRIEEVKSSGTTFNIGIVEYNPESDVLEVIVNGYPEYEESGDWVSNGTTVTFSTTKIAGTEIVFRVIKSVDGVGLNDAAATITEYQTALSNVNSYLDTFNYRCNGSTDNIELSKLVNNFLKENLSDYDIKKIMIHGNFGITGAKSGTGTSTNRYKWFDFSEANESQRKIILDFSNCSTVQFPIATGTDNILFSCGSNNITIQNINFEAKQPGTNTVIQGVHADGEVTFENCRGWITCHSTLTFAEKGTYNNCRINCYSSNANCVVFGTTDYVAVNGGVYWARTSSGTYSAVVYHGTTLPAAVSILNSVRMPTYSGGGQTNAVRINSGYINMTNCVTALVVALTSNVTSSIVGTIPLSK